MRREWRKLEEEERKRKEEENATLHKSNAPKLINFEPNPSLSLSPLVPAPTVKKENNKQEKISSI